MKPRRASVTLPPKYNFSFEAQRSLVKFAPGSLGALAAQFGEVKTISEVLFAAHVNSLDGIQRVRVSDDDASGPQADYFDDHSVTNNLAVLTPYQITFRSFSHGDRPGARRLCLVAARIHRQEHQRSTGRRRWQATSPEAAGRRRRRHPLPTGTPGRGGLQTVLNEQLLRVTLVVEVVKLSPKK